MRTRGPLGGSIFSRRVGGGDTCGGRDTCGEELRGEGYVGRLVRDCSGRGMEEWGGGEALWRSSRLSPGEVLDSTTLRGSGHHKFIIRH